MIQKSEIQNVDFYISAFPSQVRELLEEVRGTIINAAPEAEEVISYGMPAYKWNGILVYFAGYKNHIGFYPGAGAIVKFKKEIAKYKWAKGSVQFPVDQPMPLTLIARIVKFRLQQNKEKAGKKNNTKKKK